MDKTGMIVIQGARQHNLKNIDLAFPRNKLVVITGLSGSGKSSIAFDTLYAEGQRRYVESLSTYARQFLGRMEKPDVDTIDGLSPSIAIEQKSVSHNPRSTVGTVTEIYDYLRLLYARAGTPHCHACGKEIVSKTLDEMIDQVLSLPQGTKLIILSPYTPTCGLNSQNQLKRLKKNGYTRLRLNGKMVELDDIKDADTVFQGTVDVVIDRLIVKEGIQNRLSDSLELALAQSRGQVTIAVLGGDPSSKTDGIKAEEIGFSEIAVCQECGIGAPDLSPASFSFNSHQGACTACEGIGVTNDIDPDLLVPNPMLSLREGAVIPWANRESMQFFEFLDALTSHYGVTMNTPYNDLPEPFKTVLMYGSGSEEIPFYFDRDGKKIIYKKTYEGVITNLKNRLLESSSARTKDEIKQYISVRPCPQCRGERLNPASRAVHVGGMSLPAFCDLSVSRALEFMKDLRLDEKKAAISHGILEEIVSRLTFLENVGLKYLTLSRRADTLSGGENQRIRLATQIGSKLTGVLYVLDEPSIGLHQRDNLRLLSTLKQIRNLGNTVLVVEHDEETILSSDYVIDMGPGAGINGGEVIFSGKPEQLLKDERSLTGQYFSGRKKIEIPLNRRKPDKGWLTLRGASENNLASIDVDFPLSCLTCVTGVSGSGKSTLVILTLYRVLAQRLYHAKIKAGAHVGILGTDLIDKVIDIDQAPIGKTPRSNPATYTGIFTMIRELFSKTQDARARGYKAGRFSFNAKGGRCEACSGDGIIKIEMHFLPDVYVPCDVCRGKRYNRETLEIRYKGKTIADVLDMTVNQALSFFAPIAAIREKLETLKDVGLGYIHLGQSATTLSGGESQRIKLAKELGKKDTGKTVYILDEPTTGLHIEDISKLLIVLNRLVDAGNTVIIIEHNLDVIKCADHIIDIGPEGGDKGGRIVVTGPPETIICNPKSHTGHFLKHHFHIEG